jgi:hypothetical protein
MQAPPTLKSFLPFIAGALFGVSIGFSVSYVGSRYQISTANGGYDNMKIPVFVKFDRWTGAAWYSTGAHGTWRPFKEESAFTPPPLSSEEKPVRNVAGN